VIFYVRQIEMLKCTLLDLVQRARSEMHLQAWKDQTIQRRYVLTRKGASAFVVAADTIDLVSPSLCVFFSPP